MVTVTDKLHINSFRTGAIAPRGLITHRPRSYVSAVPIRRIVRLYTRMALFYHKYRKNTYYGKR